MILRVRHALRTAEVIVLNGVSKAMTIEDLRKKVSDEFKIDDPSVLRLFCNGKILEDGPKLLEYRIEDGYTIFVQEMMGKAIAEKNGDDDEASKVDTTPKIEEEEIEIDMETGESEYFEVGQEVDVHDSTDGSWYEAKIDKICKKTPDQTVEDEDLDGDGMIYFCRFDEFADTVEQKQLRQVRPRAFPKVDLDTIMKASDVENGPKKRYLVNYNFESPGELGQWFEAELIPDNHDRRTRIRSVTATIYATNGAPVSGCKVTKLDEIYVIRDRCPEMKGNPGNETYPPRTRLDCRRCFDNPKKKPTCHYCMCVKCHTDENQDQLLACDECDEMYHTYCLTPPIPTVPEDNWYCPECKIDENEVIKTGEAEKLRTKRLRQMPSANQTRKWGGKHSCDGVSKKCTIVPSDHYGPIPGVDVGTCWRYRKQVSEAGVHRPLVAGIHGKEKDAAYSIVVAGGYEDDKDEGNRIIYTGSGGRDLTGNKRINKQSMNQTLERYNQALARNCYAETGKLNETKGHKAGANWMKGKPVRVVRSYKLKNDFGPAEGFRYDGIYKVVKYWPAEGKEGFVVWKYELRRDDPTPAPWTKEGQQLIRSKGLDTVIECEDDIEKKKGTDASGGTTDDDDDSNGSTSGAKKAKRPKMASFSVTEKQMKLIKKDKRNDAMWKECLKEGKKGAAAFFKKLEDVFACAICQQVVHRPVTLTCNHTLCMACIQRSKAAECDNCPSCRQPMGEDMAVNEELKAALESLLPGYAKGRDEEKKRSYKKKKTV